MTWLVTKTYDHNLGLSACFRQWRADSHCRFLHGYALSFKLVFACETLDAHNWVIDFGGLKSIKKLLEETFDHKLLVAEDDPQLDELSALAGIGLADVLVLPGVGCEKFAEFVWENANAYIQHCRSEKDKRARDVQLISVECREHAANSAIYQPEQF